MPTTTESSSDDGANKSAYSASLVAINFNDQDFTVKANKSGTMKVAIYIDGSLAGYINDGKNVSEGNEYEFHYSSRGLSILGYGQIEIRVQVTDGDSIYRSLVIPVEELD